MSRSQEPESRSQEARSSAAPGEKRQFGRVFSVRGPGRSRSLPFLITDTSTQAGFLPSGLR